jgi:hypothetical protein
MMPALVVIAALWLFVWGWCKYGVRRVIFWSCLIGISVFPLSFTGMILAPVFDALGVQAPSMPVQMAIAVGAVFVAMMSTKYIGLGRVLGGVFKGALVVASLVILGFILCVVAFGLAGGGR